MGGVEATLKYGAALHSWIQAGSEGVVEVVEDKLGGRHFNLTS